MEIVERYLQAIEFWLAKEQRQDIIAEISEDIHSQIEEREEQLGRKLSEAELEILIKQRGRPLLVANRYLPQQFLIGPLLFPTYAFVLKICALCYLLPWFAVSITVYRLQHPALSWTNIIATALSSLGTAAFFAAAVITIIFAVLQKVEAQTHFLENWNPRELPPARNPSQISRTASVIELVVYLAVIVYWVSYASSPNILRGPALRITLSPVWAYFFWGFLVVALLNTALSAANLMRPYWTGVRALFRMAIDGMGSALFCWLLKANIIATLGIAGTEPSRAQAIRNAIQIWMERAFPLAVIGVMVILAVDMYRVIRVNKKAAVLSRDAVAVLFVLLLTAPAIGSAL